MESTYRMLVINPGSTSTKIGIYDNEKPVLIETIRHEMDDLQAFNKVNEQYVFRKTLILELLHQHGINITKLNAVVGRGGLLRPILGGTYRVDEAMVKDLYDAKYGEHASNLGGIIAFEIANQLNIPAYIVDPVVVDEMLPIARISGLPEIKRRSIFHALNQRAVARQVAAEMKIDYKKANFIVCHMGGGITVGAHHQGRIIDVNNGLDGDGPFSPERAGTLPVGDLITLCYSGQYTEGEMRKMTVGQGGLVAYLGTNNAVEVENQIKKGNNEAKLTYSAMAYQIAKEIGAYSTVLKGKIDAIILTGGLAYGKDFVKEIIDSVDWIAPIRVVPGENELQALVEGTLQVLRGLEEEKIYNQESAYAK